MPISKTIFSLPVLASASTLESQSRMRTEVSESSQATSGAASQSKSQSRVAAESSSTIRQAATAQARSSEMAQSRVSESVSENMEDSSTEMTSQAADLIDTMPGFETSGSTRTAHEPMAGEASMNLGGESDAELNEIFFKDSSESHQHHQSRTQADVHPYQESVRAVVNAHGDMTEQTRVHMEKLSDLEEQIVHEKEMAEDRLLHHDFFDTIHDSNQVDHQAFEPIHYKASPAQHTDDFQSYTIPQNANNGKSVYDPELILGEVSDGYSRMVHEGDMPDMQTQTRSLDYDENIATPVPPPPSHHRSSRASPDVLAVGEDEEYAASTRKRHYNEAHHMDGLTSFLSRLLDMPMKNLLSEIGNTMTLGSFLLIVVVCCSLFFAYKITIYYTLTAEQKALRPKGWRAFFITDTSDELEQTTRSKYGTLTESERRDKEERRKKKMIDRVRPPMRAMKAKNSDFDDSDCGA